MYMYMDYHRLFLVYYSEQGVWWGGNRWLESLCLGLIIIILYVHMYIQVSH